MLSEDENCYGEIISSVADSNYVTVCVVDYYKMKNLPRSKVRMIKYHQSRFTELPMQALMEKDMLILVQVIK